MEFYNSNGIFQSKGKADATEVGTVVATGSVDPTVLEEVNERLSDLEKSNNALSTKLDTLNLKVYTRDEINNMLSNNIVVYEDGVIQKKVYSQAKINNMINDVKIQCKDEATNIVKDELSETRSDFESLKKRISELTTQNTNAFLWYLPNGTVTTTTIYSVNQVHDYCNRFGLRTKAYTDAENSLYVYNTEYINDLIDSNHVKIGDLNLTTDTLTVKDKSNNSNIEYVRLSGIERLNGNLIIDGDLTVNGVISQISDEHEKQDIKHLNPIKSLWNILNLKSYSYKLHGQDEYGLLVQQAQDVVPICVKNGKTLNYVSLIPLLINSVKTLSLLVALLVIGMLVVLL